MLNSDQTRLKITVEAGENTTTLKLDGKVGGPLVNELNHVWHSLASSLDGKRLVIDLRNVIFIDKAGVAVLAEIHSKTGAQFQADAPLTKYFVELAMRSSAGKEERKGA